MKQTTVSATALHSWKVLRGQTLAARIKTVLWLHWDPLYQLTLGSQTGLRGYPNYMFTGQRLLLFNLEHRVYPRIQLWFVRLGGALFFDSGTVWDPGQKLRKQRLHSAVGAGLRFETGRNGGGGIFRLDAAYNLDQRRFGITFSSGLLFSALSGMEFIEPVPGRSVCP